jgi:hypothetical protein
MKVEKAAGVFNYTTSGKELTARFDAQLHSFGRPRFADSGLEPYVEVGG